MAPYPITSTAHNSTSLDCYVPEIKEYLPNHAFRTGYIGNSFTVRVMIVFLGGLAIYNALEVICLTLYTFRRYRSLYFWSLIVASTGIVPYCIGFLLKQLLITTGKGEWLALSLITVGWWPMVTGQSVVLWSRLHLLVDAGDKGAKVLRWTKYMIITNFFVLHLPTTVLTYGSNGNLHVDRFVAAYNIMEKLQMTGFFAQECILSAVYIIQAFKLFKYSVRQDKRRFMALLLVINLVIVGMDVAMVSVELAGLYMWEMILKGAVYSIKLKLEFAILGKLVQFVGGSRNGSFEANLDRWQQATLKQAQMCHADGQADLVDVEASDQRTTFSASQVGSCYIHGLVDLTKVKSETQFSIATTIAIPSQSQQARKQSMLSGRRRSTDEEDISWARFEHLEGTRLPSEDGIVDQRQERRSIGDLSGTTSEK